MGQAIEDPGALRQALDQPAIGQQAQMARDPRLALPQDLGDLADRQLAFGQQRHQPQAGGFARRAQTLQQMRKLGHGHLIKI